MNTIFKKFSEKYEDIYNKYLCKNFFMLHSRDADTYIYIYEYSPL
jgi:hypothetical protein